VYYFGQEEEEMKLCLMILSVPWFIPYPEWIKFLAPETNTGLLLQKIGCTVIWNYFQL
jgi:hypothetical protein